MHVLLNSSEENKNTQATNSLPADLLLVKLRHSAYTYLISFPFTSTGISTSSMVQSSILYNILSVVGDTPQTLF